MQIFITILLLVTGYTTTPAINNCIVFEDNSSICFDNSIEKTAYILRFASN